MLKHNPRQREIERQRQVQDKQTQDQAEMSKPKPYCEGPTTSQCWCLGPRRWKLATICMDSTGPSPSDQTGSTWAGGERNTVSSAAEIPPSGNELGKIPHLFSDRSAQSPVRNGGGGATLGILAIPQPLSPSQLAKISSNYRAELQAIIAATQYQSDKWRQWQNIAMVTDSVSSPCPPVGTHWYVHQAATQEHQHCHSTTK